MNCCWGSLGKPADEDPPRARLLHLVDTGLAVLRHAIYQDAAHVPTHRHDCASIVYGVGGPCHERRADGAVIRRRLTFLPDGYEHTLDYEGATHVLAIEIDPKWLRENYGGRFPSEMIALPATVYDRVWEVLIAVTSGASHSAVSLAVERLARESVAYVLAPPAPLVKALLDELHQHWKVVPSVSRLARKYSLSKQHLCRAFKKAVGVTLRQYGLIIRLDRARALLWSTGLPIADVAHQTGFSDQSHLTRALSAHSARSPLRLRLLAPCRLGNLVSLPVNCLEHVSGGRARPPGPFGASLWNQWGRRDPAILLG